MSTEDGTGIHRSRRKGLEIQEGHPVLLMDSCSEGQRVAVSACVSNGRSEARCESTKVHW